MKKYIFLAVLLSLSACTLPWSKTDTIPAEHNFSNDYQRHIKAVFEHVDDTLSDMYDFAEKISPSGYDNSTIRMSASVPGQGSGEVFIKADAIRQTRVNRMSAEIDMRGFVQTLDESIRLDTLRGGLITDMGGYLLRLDEVKISGSGSEFLSLQKEIESSIKSFEKYYGKWVSLSIQEAAELGSTNDPEKYLMRIIAPIQMDILQGGKKLRKVLAAHPPIRSTASLGNQGDMYSYAVELDQTGALALVDGLSLEYAGTGLTSESRKSIEEFLSTKTLSGIISIDAKNSEYFTFSGTIMENNRSMNIDMAFLEKSIRLIVSENEKEIIKIQGETTKNNTNFSLALEGHEFIKIKAEQDTLIEFTLTPRNNAEIISLIYKKNPNKTFSIIGDSIDPISKKSTALARIEGESTLFILTSLSGSVFPGESRATSFNYTLDLKTKEFKMLLKNEQLPGDIVFDGHIKKDDIELNMTVAGIGGTFLHKKSDDGTFDGSLKLPVANIQWSGKEKKDFFESVLVRANSPAGNAEMDLKTVDGWLSGKLNITPSQLMTASDIQDISIDIRAKRSGKDFSLRIDAPMGVNNPEKIHFEWDSSIDIKWDKDAVVKIPTETIPLSQVIEDTKVQ